MSDSSGLSQPDPGPDEPAVGEEAIRVLEDYRQALQRGGPCTPEEWLSTHTGLPEDVGGELRLLRLFQEARQIMAEDTTIDLPQAGQTPAEIDNVLQPGTRVGECVIKELLGSGGMGEVYLAFHDVLKRPVAVKVLAARLADEPGAAQRFQREMQLLARMGPHPNLVVAMHASTHEGRLYLVMEYV